MRRRTFATLAGSATLSPLMARAQSGRTLRVGTANAQPRAAPQWQAFLARMAELGYREGDNLTYDHVQIPNPQAWEASYREVIARKPDIVVASGPENSLKAAIATAGKLPIVMIAVDFDPVAKGYVKSLSRPGANATGVYFQSVELVGKRLDILRTAFPNITTMMAFWDPSSVDHWQAVQADAPRFGLRVTGVEFRQQPYDYDRAVADTTAGTSSFLYCGASPFFFLDRQRLAQFAIQHRLVAMYDLREFVVAGSLMSYGPSLTAMFALAANYVDRIAKGARPSDTPIEQPTKFELVLNLKTANAMGLVLPPTLLARADEQIE
ncbi:MAG: ABC transporter substrate-binding protein [Reyranella sp.]|jgi:putative ABC transport system substrate-binding protein|nr:ABC transporter substrate-binding protein [Reyranella sp.]